MTEVNTIEIADAPLKCEIVFQPDELLKLQAIGAHRGESIGEVVSDALYSRYQSLRSVGAFEEITDENMQLRKIKVLRFWKDN